MRDTYKFITDTFIAGVKISTALFVIVFSSIGILSASYFFVSAVPWQYIVGGILLLFSGIAIKLYIIFKQIEKEQHQKNLVEQEKNKVRYIIID
ncbi:hypothetical protein SAMN05660772_01827 [Pasteurella testudinis DSM 23072]|uniref:Uncharacterized protein n=1 Tax=Pasteurella testudinis DSM 23072 TaxID=1122938 RepID=A0A1W1UJX1_9PAST|nr:hypothetical protein [Pasteurella testudinis]SMB81367.1 hypothetical protein SAMN05660772_01827 [Pasteurella testudinis DSM 23072]SUB51384.1 Uncharacterised protein [Pasteurella testudinis]